MATNVLLRGGVVVDGTGAPPRRADVAVRDGMITAVGAAPPGETGEVVDLDGLVLAPGFIDVHTHDDRLLLSDPSMTPKLSQGVTTVVTGNCGISLAPLGAKVAVPPLNLVAAEPGARPSQRFDSFAGYLTALEAQPATSMRCAEQGTGSRPLWSAVGRKRQFNTPPSARETTLSL